jgi:DNA modification methylase
VRFFHGDCLEKMRELGDGTIDSIVTDPPYGLSFMGKGWDHGVPGSEFWVEALRVAKPGTHLLAFGGTRTYHRLAVAIEDAGWEIRDCVMWVYGSGFPKSHNVGKGIDKAAGAEREVIGKHRNPAGNKAGGNSLNMSAVGMPDSASITAPATAAAKQWDGWGTALKPAYEPIIVARKPLTSTVAENVLRHGTGAINVDGCRVDASEADLSRVNNTSLGSASGGIYGKAGAFVSEGSPLGRWPANLIHDGSDEVVGLFPSPHGAGSLRQNQRDTTGEAKGMFPAHGAGGHRFGDSGSAARFFYCAKASKKDRDEGNGHPTVKPTDLMRYLCRLVTPPEGIVLDPFMGSGSTGKAAMLEGFDFVGIEKEADYIKIAEARIAKAKAEKQEQLL